MKNYFCKLLILLALLFSAGTALHAQIWSENFDGYPNATTQDPPKWTSVATDCDDGGDLNLGMGISQWGVYAGQFTINDIEGAPCCNGGIEGGGNNNYWETEIIDISNNCDVSISLEVTAAGFMECDSPGAPIFGCSGMTPPDNSHDQVVAQYNLDGGGWTQFGYVCAANGVGTLSVGGLNGNNLQIRVYAANKSNSEYYYFDNVVVNGSTGTPPTFAQIGPLCETDPPVNLPTTSIEGVTGSWDVGATFNPAGQGNTTTTITFTPNPGQCASPTTMNIVVNEPTLPTLAPLGPFCNTDPPQPLGTNQGGIDGNWSGPGVSGNTFTPSGQSGTVTLTFTPNPTECASPATLDVTVNLAATPNLGTATVCENAPPYDLSQLLDPNYPNGTWSGPGVAGGFFSPSGQNGAVNLIFTSSAPCVLPASTTVTVQQPVTPVLQTASICQNNGLFDLTQLQDPNYPNGTWSGPGVAGTNFNPAGQNGNVSLTFTSSDICVDPATTTITVTPNVTPMLMTANVCQTGGMFDLTPLLDPNFPTGTWSGPGIFGNFFDPSGQSGNVTLTFTSSTPCVLPATTTVTVQLPATPNLGSATICQSSGPYDLTQLQDPNFPTGTWSGNGVNGTTFDPSGQSGPVNLTFTPSSSCAFPATTSVTVVPGATPNLGTATICQSSGPYDLTQLQDPNFPTGTWSGMGVAGTLFVPTGLSGGIPLTFTSNEDCTFPATTTITVEVPGTPVLGTVTLCQTSGTYNLTQLNDPNFPAGTWNGPGVTGSNFDPNGQSGAVTLVFTPTANCANTATTDITVEVPQTPNLGSTSICASANPLDLTTLNDPNYPAGTWSGPGVTGNDFDPSGQSGPVTLTFSPSADCTNAGTTTVTVNEAPTFSNLTDDCDLGTQTFTISFDIAGGTAPYTVDGNAVTGTTFTSAALPSGTMYSFQLDDANGCGPVTISGTVNCSCATDAGTMDLNGSPLSICHDGDIPVTHNGDDFLDGDDLLIFVLHDNAGATLGTVLATSSTTTITNPGGLVLGQTYYISAVAGSDDGTGNIDLNDPCLSVAAGVPVEFYQPTVTLVAPSETCANECAEVEFQFSFGTQPYSVEYDIFINGVSQGPYTQDNLSGTKILTLCPLTTFQMTSGTMTVEYLSFTDESGCAAIDLPTVSIEVFPIAEETIDPTLCAGESLTVNGTQYDEGNPTGQEILPNGAFNGCDSIVDISLSFFPADTNFIEQTFCTGGSLTVNGTMYDESNPSGIEILPMANVNGCDSVISVNLSFNTEVSENFNPMLCQGDSVEINGTWYWSGNPSGSETFPQGSYLGCDSTVIINLGFFPPATENLAIELCTGGSEIINGTVYDESNPSGQEVLPNASVNGCDSVINVNLTFNDEVFENLTPTLCPGESITVNGTVYDAGNPNGQETFPLGSYLGCDSTVVVGLSFYPPAHLDIIETFCTGGSVTVNGTVYDESNPIGNELIPNGSTNSCDSTIYIELTFNGEVTETIDPTLCAGDSVVVNGVVYNEGNPSGTENFPQGSYLGCDSTVVIDLSFSPAASSNFNQTLCTGASIEVNGTIYNEANPMGTEILANASSNGCDSIVNVSLNFVTEVFEDLDPELCAGESIEVNGTVYDEDNPFGEETLIGGSFYGCDSTVIIDLSFLDPVESFVEETFCTGGSLTVNGTVYDESNPSGVEVFENITADGCDSVVYVNLSFDDEVFENLELELCPGETVLVNGTLYFENNPTGSETFPAGSYLGCDSTVNVSLTYFPEAMGTVEETLLPGESVVVNGTVYDISNPTGVEIIIAGSWTGCDSTVVVDLTFEGEISVFVTVNSPTCLFGNDGSIVLDSIVGGELPYIVSLNGGQDTEVFLFPEIFSALEAGFYSLTVRDALNTVVTEEIFMDNPPEPFLDLGDDIFLDLGESATLSPETDFQPSSYLWEPADYLDCVDCPTPLSAPADDITYTLTATTPDGCVVSDEVVILLSKSRQVYAPNAFSPNNDAVNDEFTLFSGPQVAKVNRLLIFDRWGALMFENYNFPPNDLSIGWDGSYKGEMMNPGVYTWFAEVEFLDGKVELFEGGVTLVR